MIFASTALAARIEAAEVELMRALMNATVHRRPGVAPYRFEIAGGVAQVGEVGSPLNKWAGLGFHALPTEAECSSVEAAFDARGVPLQVELANLGEPEVLRMFSRRGYTLMGFENVLGLELDQFAPSSRSTHRIACIGSEAGALWSSLLLDGFAAADAEGVASHESFPREELERVLLDMAGTQGLSRYIAYQGEQAVGAAGLRCTAKVAQLTGAATLLPFRRRGVQTALLAQRLQDAREQGCDLAVVTTQPGSKSQENMQRAGFALLYARAVLVREPR